MTNQFDDHLDSVRTNLSLSSDVTRNDRIRYASLSCVDKSATLNNRRSGWDQIEVFEILNGYEILIIIFFSPKLRKLPITRGHNFTLLKKQSRLDVRKHSFSQMTITVWNKESTDCVHASNVNRLNNIILYYIHIYRKGGLHLE